MVTEDKGNFLSRWSRLKRKSRPADMQSTGQQTDAAIPAAPAAGVPVAPAAGTALQGDTAAPRELPPVDSLQGLASDYREFMQPDVDDGARRAALKKLFGDPHFNVPDPYEAYSGDFTGGEPISAAMLKTLEHARDLLADRTPPGTPAAQQKESGATGAQPEAKPDEPASPPAERKA